jgi:hypothetical protein
LAARHAISAINLKPVAAGAALNFNSSLAIITPLFLPSARKNKLHCHGARGEKQDVHNFTLLSVADGPCEDCA